MRDDQPEDEIPFTRVIPGEAENRHKGIGVRPLARVLRRNQTERQVWSAKAGGTTKRPFVLHPLDGGVFYSLMLEVQDA